MESDEYVIERVKAFNISLILWTELEIVIRVKTDLIKTFLKKIISRARDFGKNINEVGHY